MSILNGFSDWFFSEVDRSRLGVSKTGKDKNLTNDEICSRETLMKVLNDDSHVGFPLSYYGIDLLHKTQRERVPLEYRPRIAKFDATIKEFIGSNTNTVTAYYPAGGYIGWHNNQNAYGYNIICSYTEKPGDGYFRHWNHLTDEIVDFPDPGGWSVKMGYFGGNHEYENLYWHSAAAKSERITFGFVFRSKTLWENLREEFGIED